MAIISAATGTGSFTSINGVQTATAGTTGSTLKYIIAIGLTMTITGGNYINADILNQGGEQSGLYDPGQVVDVGRVDTCAVYVQTTATGVPVSQNILQITDILGTTDILGAASAAFVNVYPEIAFSPTTNPPTNWQKFAPGRFTGRYFKIRWRLETLDPTTIAYLLTAAWQVDVPDRIDHPLVNGGLASTGLAITFTPDGAGSPAAFNGGPDGGTGNPAVTVTWSGSDKATGDFEVVTGLSKTGCTVTIKDATGTSRARSNVSIYVEGW